MATNTTKNVPKMFQKFYCENCDYGCSKKSIFDKHLLTKKHNTTKYNKIQQDEYTCECGKRYKHRASLYNHKLKCNFSIQKCSTAENTKNEDLNYKDLIIKVMSENQELKNMMVEQQKTITDMVPKLGNNNNNKININVYLNEHCKDAINIEDFTENIRLTIMDLYGASENGLLENVQNVIVNRLNETDETKRPIHCTDVKRKILYVKDKDGWNRDSNNDKVKASISKIADNHMTCFANESMNENEDYMKIMSAVSQDIEKDEKALNRTVSTIANAVKLNV